MQPVKLIVQMIFVIAIAICTISAQQNKALLVQKSADALIAARSSEGLAILLKHSLNINVKKYLRLALRDKDIDRVKVLLPYIAIEKECYCRDNLTKEEIASIEDRISHKREDSYFTLHFNDVVVEEEPGRLLHELLYTFFKAPEYRTYYQTPNLEELGNYCRMHGLNYNVVRCMKEIEYVDNLKNKEIEAIDEILTLLLAAGADINAPDHHGDTPLIFAIKIFTKIHADRRKRWQPRLLALIDVFLKHGADINATTPAGETIINIIDTGIGCLQEKDQVSNKCFDLFPLHHILSKGANDDLARNWAKTNKKKLLPVTEKIIQEHFRDWDETYGLVAEFLIKDALSASAYAQQHLDVNSAGTEEPFAQRVHDSSADIVENIVRGYLSGMNTFIDLLADPEYDQEGG